MGSGSGLGLGLGLGFGLGSGDQPRFVEPDVLLGRTDETGRVCKHGQLAMRVEQLGGTAGDGERAVDQRLTAAPADSSAACGGDAAVGHVDDRLTPRADLSKQAGRSLGK